MTTRKLLVLPLMLILLTSGIIPFTFASVESEGEEDVYAGCRDGQVMVYRLTYQDYICVDPSTADRWEELGIAEIAPGTTRDSFKETPKDETIEETEYYGAPPPPPERSSTSTSGDSDCRYGHVLVYRFIHQDTFCTITSTANFWERLGLAKIIETDDLIDEDDSSEFKTENETIGDTENETIGDTENETTGDTENETTGDTENETTGEVPANVFESSIGSPKIHQLDERIWIGVGYDTTNSLLIEGDKGIIVIDTLSSYESAKKLLNDFKSITEKPVKIIIFTKIAPGNVDSSKAFIEYGDGDVEIIIHEELFQLYSGKYDVEVKPTHTFTDKFLLDVSGVKMTLIRDERLHSDQTYIFLPDDDGVLISDSIYGVSPFILKMSIFLSVMVN